MLSKLNYLFRGFKGIIFTSNNCPCCGNDKNFLIDKKFIFTLRKCQSCKILYRYPYESYSQLYEFYQNRYRQGGLTTDLPSHKTLDEFKRSNFAGTSKDVSQIIEIMRRLGIKEGDRVLDYGANWGYGVFQFCKAGFNAEGFEISLPRARFGDRLGVLIHTDLSKINDTFDIIYSGHVLEHILNPMAAIHRQLKLLKNGGYLIISTPNGSEARRKADFNGFHLHWGRVHPVLITDEFIYTNFSKYPYFLSSKKSITEISQWNQEEPYTGSLIAAELLIIIKKILE